MYLFANVSFDWISSKKLKLFLCLSTAVDKLLRSRLIKGSTWPINMFGLWFYSRFYGMSLMFFMAWALPLTTVNSRYSDPLNIVNPFGRPRGGHYIESWLCHNFLFVAAFEETILIESKNSQKTYPEYCKRIAWHLPDITPSNYKSISTQLYT